MICISEKDSPEKQVRDRPTRFKAHANPIKHSDKPSKVKAACMKPFSESV